MFQIIPQIITVRRDDTLSPVDLTVQQLREGPPNVPPHWKLVRDLYFQWLQVGVPQAPIYVSLGGLNECQ